MTEPGGPAGAAAQALVDRLREQFEAARDPERAIGMASYMKGVAPFFGIGASDRRARQKQVFRTFGPVDEATAHSVAALTWQQPEREFQYAGMEFLAAHLAVCDPARTMPLAEHLIVTRSWWDTVDVVCRHVAGELVRRDPALRSVMDRWLAADDIWLIRSAILHQERHIAEADFEWLRAACLRHGTHREFFVRKAIGWVLRTYAHQSAEHAAEVRALLAEGDFSGLTRREALARVRH